MVKRTVEEFGALHFAHNNAGIAGDKAPTHEFSEEIFDEVMKVYFVYI